MPQTKRAADDSASDWASGSDGSGSSSSSGDESEGRSYKEAAFAKVLKEVMEKRDNAEPGVLQEVRRPRRPFCFRRLCSFAVTLQRLCCLMSTLQRATLC